MNSRKRSISDVAADTRTLHKEWDEALCPICMDHPHNVVRLLCSSHEKGCRPYICDTSYRHSNCLDRFKSLREDNMNTLDLSSSSLDNILSNLSDESEIVPKLRCPLCRGTVLGWKIDEEARNYLNLKNRNCSCENCSFCGSYRELRRHARRAHPTARPSNVDPSRQHAWRSLEHEREYADIVSAIRAAMPEAVVLGDFVVEDGARDEMESGLGDGNGNGNGPWWTTYFLLEMFGSRSRAWSRQRRSSGTSSRRRYLWGENLLGIQDDDDGDDDEDDEGDEDDRIRYVVSDTDDDRSLVVRRRRFTRSLSYEDRS